VKVMTVNNVTEIAKKEE